MTTQALTAQSFEQTLLTNDIVLVAVRARVAARSQAAATATAQGPPTPQKEPSWLS